ncbi:MAG: hypothetical protein WC717_02145, partial [Candidatus Micrarchaeia archaeon]
MHDGSSSQARRFLLIPLLGILFLAQLGNPASTITSSDIIILKSYADAFNQSRDYLTPHGPAEHYCLTTGTF